MGVRRHDDADLLALARDGSSAAFAALLHRHRAVLQRGIGEAADPEAAARAVMIAVMRDLRSGADRGATAPELIAAAAGVAAMHAPRTAGIEPLLPTDWFDRAWAEVEPAWPRGRRPLPAAPRWVAQVAAGLALAVLGAGGTWLALERDEDREVVGSVVASVLEGPTVLGEAPPPPEPVVEEAPALFGDIEIGELPTYDLTSRDRTTGGARPEIMPPRP